MMQSRTIQVIQAVYRKTFSCRSLKLEIVYWQHLTVRPSIEMPNCLVTNPTHHKTVKTKTQKKQSQKKQKGGFEPCTLLVLLYDSKGGPRGTNANLLLRLTSCRCTMEACTVAKACVKSCKLKASVGIS